MFTSQHFITFNQNLTYKSFLLLSLKNIFKKNIFFIWGERLVSAFSMKKKIELKKN